MVTFQNNSYTTATLLTSAFLYTFHIYRGQPENNFFDDKSMIVNSNPLFNFAGPLFTLASIKNDWMDHPRTCINISSADILQCAIFFATTRQTGTPESLLLNSASSPTAFEKRETLKKDFLWGRPDETNCNPEWTDNLPSNFNSCPTENNIPCRCANAGGEIEEKMIKRNGFTAGKFVLLDSLKHRDKNYTRVLLRFLYFTEEANALIGAHSIGLIRNTFGVFNRPVSP